MPNGVGDLTYVGGVEHIGQKKVEQGPQLMQVILQWSSGQKQTVGRLKLPHNLRQLVFDSTTRKRQQVRKKRAATLMTQTVASNPSPIWNLREQPPYTLNYHTLAEL